jgi:threonine-phosphate decarboxylase
MTVHGGDVWQVAEELGIAASELLDFSANINPRGLPAGARERLQREASDARLLRSYPDPGAGGLRAALSDRFGVPAEAMVVGPGAEALLDPVLRATGARRALIPIPAFSEYERVCARVGIEFVPFPLMREELFQIPVDRLCQRIELESPGVVVLNNPHNPTGAMVGAEEVRRILEAANSHGATLVLDEAFIDYIPHASLVREAAQRPGLIVIRSLTKFYGCPALRVGYAAGEVKIIETIRSLLPTWPVTQLALNSLAEAVGDGAYAEHSIAENARQRERLAEALRDLELIVFPAAANYLFLELTPEMPAASELRRWLIEKHRILIRNCDSYEGLTRGRYFRVAVLSGEENDRLVRALGEALRT